MIELVAENDRILKTIGVEWDFNNPPADAVEFSEGMLASMREERGIGLAASQIGLNYRVFVMETDGVVRICFNPQVTKYSEILAVYEEGCLSFPDLILKIKRPESISVKYQDATGQIHEEELTALAARCYLHETDHADGVCFTDRVSKLHLEMAKKRRAKTGRKL